MTDDPPIIVGGGGSTYIWIRNGLSLQPEPDPKDPDYDFKDFVFKKENYQCYHLPTVKLGTYKTHNGEDEGSSHRVKVRRKHATLFFES